MNAKETDAMIFVECIPDYTLICKLRSSPSKKVEHSSGKTAVLNKLIRRTGAPNYENSIGMIDEDPLSSQPKTIKSFVEKVNIPECEIKILYYEFLNNHVLILRPRLEEWLIASANEAGISMSDYDLPNNAEHLHEIINLNVDKLTLLIDILLEKSRRMKELQKCILGQYF